jgi:hypothetical protein
MPIPPQPRTFICPCCGWQRTTTAASDALRLDIDWFCRCPNCQHTELETRLASHSEIMRERLAQFFRYPRI